MMKPSRSKLARRATALALLLAVSGAGLSACEQERKGPLERAGEKIDEGVNDAKRTVKDAAD